METRYASAIKQVRLHPNIWWDPQLKRALEMDQRIDRKLISYSYDPLKACIKWKQPEKHSTASKEVETLDI